jgi:hypothetical protein
MVALSVRGPDRQLAKPSCLHSQKLYEHVWAKERGGHDIGVLRRLAHTLGVSDLDDIPHHGEVNFEKDARWKSISLKLLLK